MQTFSNLRRNRNDYQPLAVFGYFLLFIAYEAMSTIYPYLPPLFGVMLTLLLLRPEEKVYFFVLPYLLFFEADHGYLIFSTWAFAFLFLRFIMPTIQEKIICVRCIHVIAVAIAYSGYYAFAALGDFIIHNGTLDVNYWMILFYIAIESILALIFL